MLRRRLRRLGSEAERQFLLGDPFGFLGDLPALAMEGSTIQVDPLTSTFVAEGGRTALAVLTPRSSELDPDAGRRLLGQLQDAEEELRRVHPDLELLAVRLADPAIDRELECVGSPRCDLDRSPLARTD